jgi:hypothetical protein
MFEAGENPVHGVRAKAVMAIRVQVPLGSYNIARVGSAHGSNARARLVDAGRRWSDEQAPR